MPGYLIDMDGVIYRGGEMIPGADKFISSEELSSSTKRFWSYLDRLATKIYANMLTSQIWLSIPSATCPMTWFNRSSLS